MIPNNAKAIHNYIGLWKYTKVEGSNEVSGAKNKFSLVLPRYDENHSYSLIWALFLRTLYFCDDLSYIEIDRKMNNRKYETKLIELDDRNKAILAKFKQYSRKAMYGPIMIESNKK